MLVEGQIRSQKLSVMGALAFKTAMSRRIVPDFQNETGIHPEIVWEPTTVLMRRIADGERADVVIATDDAIDELHRKGRVGHHGHARIAGAVLGIAVKSGVALPDISTASRFREVLLNARSVAYSRGGASGIYFSDLLKRLGIADAINARATVIAAGFTAEKVAGGEADIAIQQISELLIVPGVDVVGPFPEKYQVVTNFSAAIFSDAANPDAATRFIAAMQSAAAKEAYQTSGLLPRFQPAFI